MRLKVHFYVKWHLEICDDLSQLCNVHNFFIIPVIIIIILFSIHLNFNFNPCGTASVLLSQATCQYISFILGSIQQKHAFYLQLRNSFVSGNFKYLERFVSRFALKRERT